MPSAPHTRRQTKDPSTNRKSALIFLGLVAAIVIAIFVYLVLPKPRSATYALAISVTDYGYPLPNLREWKVESLTSTATKNGLLPPVPVFTESQRIESARNIEKVLQDLTPRRELRGSTLLVQLRCHAALRTKSDGKLDCELLVGESDTSHYYFSQVLQQLANCEAANIVVLADICDIKLLPAKGIISNPHAFAIQQACGALQGELREQQNLWVVTSVADGQTSLRDRKGRSLFQHSCEEALLLRPDRLSLSLAEFYENIVRYAHIASQGNQTPLLWNARTPERPCTPEQQALWSLSERVVVGTKSRIKPIAEPDPAADENTPKSDGSDGDKNVASTDTGETQDGADKEATAEVDSVKPPPKLLWDYVDYQRTPLPKSGLAKSSWPNPSWPNPSWRWGPTDYQPLEWRLFLEKIAQESLGESNPSRPIEVPTRFQEVPNFREKRFWEDSTLLPIDAQAPWEQIKPEVRRFIQSVSEVLFWRNLIAELPLDRAEYRRVIPQAWESQTAWNNQLRVSLDSMANFRRRLPRTDTDVALNSWVGAEGAPTQGDATLPLHALLQSLVNQLVQTKDWAWVEETRAVTLLSSPLLSSSQRTQLAKQLSKSKLNPADTQWRSFDEPIANLLPSGVGNANKSRDLIHEEVRHFQLCATSIAKLYSPELQPQEFASDGSGTEGALGVGSKFLAHSEGTVASFPGLSRINRWFFLSVAEPSGPIARLDTNTEPFRTGSRGIATYPSNAKAVYAKKPTQEYIAIQETGSTTAKLSLPVGFLDDFPDPLSSSSVRWRLSSGLSPSPVLLTVQGLPWNPNVYVSLPIKNKLIEIELRWDGRSPIPEGERILFNTEDQATPIELPLFINAEFVDLVLEQRTPHLNSQPIVGSSDSLHDISIVGPLVSGTSAKYEMFLRNKLNRERHVVLKLYTDRGRSPTSLIAQSNPMSIPPFQGGKVGRVPVLFPDLEVIAEIAEQIVAKSNEGRALATVIYTTEEYDQPLTPSPPSADSPAGPAPKRIAIHEAVLHLGEIPLNEMVRLEFDRDVRVGASPTVRFIGSDTLWNAFSPGKFDIQLETIHATKPGSLPSVPTPKLALAPSPAVTTTSLLPLRSEERYDFAVSLGGYPRNLFLTMDANARDKLVASPFQSRLVPEKLRLVPIIDGQPEGQAPLQLIPLTNRETQAGDAFVFPSWIGDRDVGIQLQGVRIRGEFDAPKGDSVFWKLKDVTNPHNESGAEIQGKWRDRNYAPKLKFQGNRLELGFDVLELDRTIDLRSINRDISSEWELELRAGSVVNAQVVKKRLLLDRTPPRARSRLTQGNRATTTMYLDSENVEFHVDAIDPTPAASGISTCRFILSRSRERNRSAELGTLDMPTTLDNGTLRAILSGSKLAALNLVHGGEYWIHAVTVDVAGNSQEENYPISVKWFNTPKPAEKE